MNAPLAGGGGTSGEGMSFRPFTRVLSVPPAWPWDQARAARLEAQHTSPVSGDSINILVRRLEPWRLNEPGRYVAVYLRAGEARAGQGFDIEVQGRRVHIDLPSPALRAAMIRERAWQAGAVIAIVLGMGCLGTLTFQRRDAFDDRLTADETRIHREAHLAKAVLQAGRDAQTLAGAGLDHQDLDQALADLKYVTLAKDPAVRVDAFYWNKGYWAVEGEGDAPPVRDANLNLQRSARPVRRGVWLWAAQDQETSR